MKGCRPWDLTVVHQRRVTYERYDLATASVAGEWVPGKRPSPAFIVSARREEGYRLVVTTDTVGWVWKGCFVA